MASAGRAWVDDEVSKDEYADAYGPPKRSKVNSTTVPIAAGAGLTVLGAKHWSDSKNVPQAQASRTAAVNAKHAVNVGRLSRAVGDLQHQETMRANAKLGTGWMRAGKVKEARRTHELVSRETDKTKALLDQHKAMSTPENIALRGKRMGRGGKVMVATGLTTATAPLWMKKVKKSVEITKTTPSGVSKTITQARYGANAEMGRMWRGEDKKEPRSGQIAAGSLGVGAAGGVTALAAHHNRPDKVVNRVSELTAETSRAGTRYANSRLAQENLERSLRRTKLMSGTGDTEALKLIRGAHGIKPKAMPVTTKRPKGKVRASKLIGVIEGKHKAAVAETAAHRADVSNAWSKMQSHTQDLASNKVSRARHAKVRGAGLAVAGLGAAGAVAAGIKAERNRGPFKQVKRTTPQYEADLQARAAARAKRLQAIEGR